MKRSYKPGSKTWRWSAASSYLFQQQVLATINSSGCCSRQDTLTIVSWACCMAALEGKLVRMLNKTP